MLSILQEVARYFAEQQAGIYLVGGSLRNLLLGEACVDWDLVTDGQAHRLARRLADRLGGFYAYLHEKASRVVLRGSENEGDLVLDIAPLHGKTLEEDLRTRDFTLNALAAPLAPLLEQLAQHGSFAHAETVLIDPLYGQADLMARLIRVVDTEVFLRDPLRMLRALRLAQRYNLTLDTSTQVLLRRDAGLLTQAAAERIHDELYAILTAPGALEQLHRLDKYGLLTVLIPELSAARDMSQPFPHYWDVLEHSLQCVSSLESLTTALQGTSTTLFAPELAPTPAANEDLTALSELLAEAEQQQIFSFAELSAPPMKLAALLHDIGKPLTRTVDENGAIHFYNHPYAGAPVASGIMRRLGASTHDRRLAQLIAAHHMRPGQLGQDGAMVTARAIRRYFVDLGPTGILVALLSLADHLATLGPQPRTSAWTRHLSVARLLLTSYIRERAKLLPPRLVRPDELMSRLKIPPGPLVGQLLEIIAEAQTDGTIHSREEAILLAKEYIETSIAQKSP
ncbi:MAG TPA: HD domain-containing protein [Ktedonobacteraceae bacterium]|nr:HD domain-containing protein [Ktedonobacteraceae bacterium]